VPAMKSKLVSEIAGQRTFVVVLDEAEEAFRRSLRLRRRRICAAPL
jgi:hypothetical protein